MYIRCIWGRTAAEFVDCGATEPARIRSRCFVDPRPFSSFVRLMELREERCRLRSCDSHVDRN